VEAAAGLNEPGSKSDDVFLPGGHDKGIRQILDSQRVHELLAEYFPLTGSRAKNAAPPFATAYRFLLMQMAGTVIVCYGMWRLVVPG